MLPLRVGLRHFTAGKSINDMGSLRIFRKEGTGGDPCNTFRIGANSGDYTPLSGLSEWTVYAVPDAAAHH